MANPTAYAKISLYGDNIRQGKENPPSLHFYVQNIDNGLDATVFTVASSSITPDSPTGFGKVLVLDDKLTEGPELDSPEVGRLQAITALVGMQTMAILHNFIFYFTSGKYNGSMLVIFRRNEDGVERRELAVVGGNGLFRCASGYAFSTTYLNDVVAGRLVLKYKVYLTYPKMVE